MNVVGTWTLFKKECFRFLRVTVQTVLTPVVTSCLYFAVFAQVMSDRVTVYEGISYVQFLVPGLVMMTVVQNAYANTSSSLIQSKMNGNLVFMLLSPLSSFEIYIAYVLGGVVRGVLVGAGVLAVAVLFVHIPIAHIGLTLLMVILSSALLACLGLLAGIWAEQFDQMAIFQNFLVMPLSFLSGVFYSLNNLPPIWATLSRFNPFFYMVDGFRYGVLGQSDSSPWLSLAFVFVALLVVSVIALRWLSSGYKIRS